MSLCQCIIEWLVVLLCRQRVIEAHILREDRHIPQLQTVKHIIEEGRRQGRSYHRTAGDQEKGIIYHQLRVHIFHRIHTESDKQDHHSHSPEKHRKIQHFVPPVRCDPEIEDSQIDHITQHPSGYQYPETPPLPAEPPETDHRPADKPRQHPEIQKVGMYAVYPYDIIHITGHQRTGGRKEHHQHHEEIADQRLAAVQHFQFQIRIFPRLLPELE